VSTHTHRQTAGLRGRRRARGLAVAALVVAVLGSTTRIAASDQVPAVEVTETAGLYRVSATFTVDEPTRAALAALTDYPGIPRFMPEVELSSVVARRSDGVLVEQAAVAKFLMFSRRIHLLLDITERPGSVSFRDTCGQSFEHYDGSWTVEASGGRTHITYALAAKPAFDVPEFLLRRLLKRDAVRMIARLRTEIAARAARPTPADCRSAACQ
jgi:carbon monoxide dehydrogenase subunit G